MEVFFADIAVKLTNTYSKIVEMASNIVELPSLILEKILDSALFTAIGNIYDSIITIGGSILDIPQLLYDEFMELLVLLFVPSEEFIDTELQPVFDKFEFVFDIYDFVSDVVGVISTGVGEPPTFTIHLLEKYGGSDVVINFEWYKPYKPMGDAILSAIFYLVYSWNTFLHLPNILQGVSNAGTVTGKVTKD